MYKPKLDLLHTTTVAEKEIVDDWQWWWIILSDCSSWTQILLHDKL